MQLDAIDRRLLRAVQSNCRLPAHALGEVAGLSASAAQRRLARLREARVIREEVAVVAPEAVGWPLTLIVEVQIEHETEGVARAFRRRVVEAPEVVQCYQVTGTADYVLICRAQTMEGYEEFARRLFATDPDVSRYITSVVMRPIKVGLAVPIDDVEGE